jgi:hypothetical protein
MILPASPGYGNYPFSDILWVMKIPQSDLDSQKIEEITHLPIAHRFNRGY